MRARRGVAGVTAIRKRYLALDGAPLHYRWGGNGPPLVALHGWPGASAVLHAALPAIAAGARVYAPDLFENDFLARFDGGVAALTDLVQALDRFADALGLARFALYGQDEGAAPALAYAVAHPARVSALAVGGLLPPDDTAAAALLRASWPDLTPTDDGRHVVVAWNAVRDRYIFVPWEERSGAARRRCDLPSPAMLHLEALALLRAGAQHPLPAKIALRDWPFAAGVQAERLPDAVAADPPRLAEALDGLALRGGGRAPAALPVQPHPQNDDVVALYVESEGRLLHCRAAGSGGVPLLLIHASPGSAAALVPLLRALATDRLVLAFDTPGNGASEPLPLDAPAIGDYADALAAALEALGIEQVDVWGSHTGADIGLELALRYPRRVRALAMDGVALFDVAFREAIVPRYLLPLEPEQHGLHLLRAWHMSRDMVLYWPWCEHTAAAVRPTASSPAALHELALDLMQSGATYARAYRAAFFYPLEERLPLAKLPVLFTDTAGDPLAPMLQRGLQLCPAARVARTAGVRTAEGCAVTAAALRAFFASL